MRDQLSDSDKKSHDEFKRNIDRLKLIIRRLEASGELRSSKTLDRLKKEINYPVEWVTTPLSQSVRLELIQHKIAQNQSLHCVWDEYQKRPLTKDHSDLLHFLSCELVRIEKNDARFSKKGVETEKLTALRKMITFVMINTLLPRNIQEKVTSVMRMRRGFFSPISSKNSRDFFKEQQKGPGLLYVPPSLPDSFAL